MCHLWLQFCKTKYILSSFAQQSRGVIFRILITSYPCIFSIRSFSVRQRGLFIHRLLRSPWYFSLPSSYLPFCHLSSPLEAVQVHGEEGKLKQILIAALLNAAVREEWATIVWHLYLLWISIIYKIPTSH